MPKNELSFNDIRDLLSRAINAGNEIAYQNCWIRDVYSSSFVYEDGPTGDLMRRDYVIGSDNTVTLGDPKAVIEQTSYEPVEMAAFDMNGEYSEEGDFVILKGKIFEAGDYPDKNFSITGEELEAAAAGFNGAPLDYGHVAGPLDGKMGSLTAVEAIKTEKGTDFIGTVKMPKWLDNALGATARKVSCTWNRATKTLEKLALVNNPRVPDAVLVSAFAEFEASKQAAETQPETEKPTTIITTDPTPKETKLMSEVNFAETPEYKAMQDKLAALEAANENLKTINRHKDAEAFAEGEISSGRALPAERLNLVASFELAAKDDEVSPTQVTFAEGKTGSRVDLLKASHAARPNLKLTEETLRANGGQVLLSQTTAEEATQAEFDQKEVDALLASTEAGRKALAARAAGK